MSVSSLARFFHAVDNHHGRTTDSLGLEGSVKYLHHRHLMQEADASLLKEIKSNAAGMEGSYKALSEQRGFSMAHIAILAKLIAHPNEPIKNKMTL